MIARLLLATALLTLVTLLALAARTVARRRQARLLGHAVATGGSRGTATILYFSGPHCRVCHTLQEPALQRLASDAPLPIEVRQLDATVEQALARQFNVLTVPTTIVLDPGGTVKAINNGFASERQLRAQLVS